MTKPSLILRFNGTSKLIEIVNIHHSKILKEIPCNDQLFLKLDSHVRAGDIHFDYLLGDNIRSVNDIDVPIFLKGFREDEKAPPAPIHHARFKEGNKVYIGQTPYTFNGMHDMNTARLITARGEHVKEPIEKVYIPEPEEEHTGGSSSYYMVTITHPTTLKYSYQAECNDMIEALQMTPAEANIFKAVWRTAAHRQGKKKKGNNAYYDAEKIIFFGGRMLVAADTEKE